MLRRISLFLSLSLFLVLAGSAQGQAVVLPPFGVFTDPDWLVIDYHRVNVRIVDQVATTEVAMQFTNVGEGLAEGTFLFPLPAEAAVENLIMVIDGQPIEAKILRADEARAIYDEIVRQYRDPALLEYVGRDVIQANVFPIPVGESRRIEITYGQVLPAENGLIQYVYPLHSNHQRLVQQMSLRVDVSNQNTLGNIYSPSHAIAISRTNDNRFVVGFEENQYIATNDFTLYFGLAGDEIGTNLLTYRESATEDGFFMLLVQPPLSVSEDRIQARDVVIVLDQSGSMQGQKWDQAVQATLAVLDKLNPRDRFNIISFSTGWRVYANELLPASEREEAKRWVTTLRAEGGTDIHGSLATAFSFADAERDLTILFLTDGLATEGITATPDILASLRAQAPGNGRIFAFGVGDDVDTFLLDALTRDFSGTSTYVRPGQRIDEAVASLYSKISAPVLTDVTLTIDGATTELLYPQTLRDLFAGEQITLVGRYRRASGPISIRLSGKVDGQERTYIYDDLTMRETAGGEGFIARLWATRRIGDLLNSIRLNGESAELVDSVVALSIRYGIITPYTSFLIEEDDIFSQQGRERAQQSFGQTASDLADTFTGSAAVDAAEAVIDLSAASAPMQAPAPTIMRGGAPGSGPADEESEALFYEPAVRIREAGDKTFILANDVWTDSTYDAETMSIVEIVFLSDAYFDLLAQYPQAGAYLALGEQVLMVLDGVAYQVVPEA